MVQGEAGFEMGQKTILVCQDGFFSLDLSFSTWKIE